MWLFFIINHLHFNSKIVNLFKILYMHILTKVIDEYKSKTHKGKVLHEYIIYLIIDSVIIEARTAFGKEQKDLTVLDIIKKYSGNIITTEETN